MRCYMMLCSLATMSLLVGISPALADEPDFDVTLKANTYYTSNLYHVSEEREDQFDSRNDPGERFHDMEGPDDIVTRAGVGLDWKWDVAKKRDLTLSLGADYFLHAQNSIANYFELEGALAYDLTRHDTVGLKVEFIPDRFRKNLSLEDPGTGERVFDRADYRQFSVAPRYLRALSKDWSTGVEYEFSQRDYGAPFDNRDRDRHTVAALLGYDGLKRIDIALAAGFSMTDTPTSTEFDIEVDRSYNDWFIDLEIEFNLPRRWEAELGVKYRNRAYTTDVEADDARYDRADDLWAFDVEIGRQMRKHLYAGLQLGWARNDSDRTDDTVESDEVGWEEYRIGLVAEWKF